MIRSNKQSGFSLLTAIFLLVVVAGLVASMVNLNIGQQATVTKGILGARTLQAAKAALEYGIFQALNGTCNATDTITFTAAEPALEPYSVQLLCAASTHPEATTNVNFYRLTATATRGNYILGGNANPDYYSRTIRATVSIEPP